MTQAADAAAEQALNAVVPGKVASSSRVKTPCVIKAFQFLNGLTIALALLLALAEALSIFLAVKTAGGVVVRLYALFFCAVVCLSELELTSGIKDSVLVKSWIGRGVFYVFVGTLVFEMKPGDANKVGKNQNLFIQFASCAMILMGGLYILMGALCVKRYRDSQIAKHKEIIQHAAMSEALRRSEA